MTLPMPVFVARDPAQITADMIAAFEAATGRVLHPAQVERVMIDLLAYRENLVRIAIQEAGQQNLLAFARFPMLDYLGELVGAVRLPARAAVTTLEFTLSAISEDDIVIPTGTRVQSQGSGITFATDASLTIPAGNLAGQVVATATTVGSAGNGHTPGAVDALMDPIGGVSTALNTTVSDGGADIEDDDRFRVRIRQAPNQFSVAGSRAAYRYHVMSLSADIIDVAVSSPAPGVVRLHPLTTGGLPSAPFRTQIETAVSAEDVRPLTDVVQVRSPTEITYAISAVVRVLWSADVDAVMAAALAAAQAYAADRRAGLGRDVVPRQIIAALMVPGVYDVTLSSPGFQNVGASSWANCTAIAVTAGARAVG